MLFRSFGPSRRKAVNHCFHHLCSNNYGYARRFCTSAITGESWEISTVQNDVSIISNGFYKNISLNKIITDFPNEVLGTTIHKKFGLDFPLLFKYLDAKQDLSIQVHPNDELAKERHNSFGKTEMWYIMQADENAKIIAGFKQNTSKKQYLESLENKTVLNLLDEIIVEHGDVFYLYFV